MSTKTNTGSPISVLAVGLLQFEDKHDKKGSPGSAAVQKMADAEVLRAKEAGYDLTVRGIDPDTPATVEDFRNLLKSRSWDGVSIGFGVRGRQEFTPFFEQLVNMVVQEVKPKPPKMLFAVMPNSIVDAIERNFGSE